MSARKPKITRGKPGLTGGTGY